MKKILFLLLVTIASYGQTYQNPTFGTVKTMTAPTSVTPPTMATIEASGTVGKIIPEDIPMNVIPPTTHYTPTTPTLKGHFQGLDNAIGNIPLTTAGNTTRIWFTGDATTIGAGTFYLTAQNKGTVANVSQSVINDDNQKKYFTQDLIGQPFATATIFPPGAYSGNLSASTTPNSARQRFTVELYKCNNAGTPIASGVSGAPVGDLGVTVVLILDSGEITLADGSVTNVLVSGSLASQFSIAAGERIRYHVSAEKVGTTAANITESVWYGNSFNSFIDVPTPITSSGVSNVSTVTGASVTNALDNLKSSIDNKDHNSLIGIQGGVLGDRQHLTTDQLAFVNKPGRYSNFKPAVTIINDGLYNGFPSVEKASNGDLLTVYRKGVTHLTFDGSIRLKRSTDNGDTWGSESTIITSVGHDYRDPNISRLANGNIIMSYYDRITPTNILIYTSISTDNGASFGTPVQLTGYADYGAVSSKVIQLVNGNLLLATYGKSGSNGLLNVFISTNNGASWSILSTISTDVFGSALKYTEPSLILMANGDVVASIRNDSTFMIARAISADSGATWSSVVDKFSGNSRAPMFLSNSKLFLTYRGVDGNSYLVGSSDSGVTYGSAIKLSSNEIGEQNEYNSVVEIKPNSLGYVYSTQNSTSTAAYVKFRYLNDPISMGDIPYFQTEGFNATGSASIFGTLYNNSIFGLSGLDLTINTNTSNTARDVILKAGNVEVFRAKGTGYGQFISRVGFGTPTPNNILGICTPAGTGGGASLQNLNGTAEYARFGVVNPGTSNNSFIGSFSNNNFSIYTNSIEKVTFYPSGGVSIGNTTDLGAGTLNVTGNITAPAGITANHVVIKSQLDLKADIASPAFTGDPKAPTPTAGDNDTSIVNSAFVTNAIATAVPYKSYLASAVATGTSNPVATTVYNNTGLTFTWTRTGTGAYIVTPSVAFTVGKAVMFVSRGISGSFTSQIRATCSSNAAFSQSDASGPVDGFPDSIFEIRVYP